MRRSLLVLILIAPTWSNVSAADPSESEEAASARHRTVAERRDRTHAIRYAVDEDRRTLEARRLHLRQHGPREWSTFPVEPDATQLEVRFSSKRNATEMTLHVRQADVKQSWKVSLNGHRLGELVRDECDLHLYLPIAPGKLLDGANVLRIDSMAVGNGTEDDVRVGEVFLDRRPLRETLGEATLDVTVVDRESRRPLPARLTLVDAHGTLQTVDAASDERQAVRQGVVYVRDGQAKFGVPAGTYVVSAGRGFEYSRAERRVDLAFGGNEKITLELTREVPTPGYVACDTHIHTRTYSGHGDSTIGERMVTLAGEGIELPIATDHNVHIDYELHARQLGVRQYLTPVPGNEVTTPAGHFNIFPIAPGARVPDHRSPDWPVTFREIFATPGARVAILNHARDLHSGVRPFGPELFQATVGERLDGAPLRFNAMEIINSGAIQTDPLQLTRDWLALLNRGCQVTPIGSSDSHDVARYVVGQGRTYVRCDDRDVANLDVGVAVDSLLAGRVSVSYGLLADLVVAGKYRSGDLAAVDGDQIVLEPRVLGPHWTKVSRVRLFANGQLVRDESLEGRDMLAKPVYPPGVLWAAKWQIPRPRHDLHLVLVATGPGIASSAWPTAKPYQPTSPDWTPIVLGVGGAVWIDGDGNGRRESPRDYATRAVATAGADAAKLIETLAGYDAAVAAQAAHLWRSAGRSPDGDDFLQAERNATPAVREGLRAYRESWRDNERARAGR